MGGDAIATELLRRAGAELDERPKVAALVRALGLTVHHGASLPGDAALVRVGDEWRIYLRRKLPRERLAFAVAHELCEWALRGYVGEDAEQRANLGAAALLVPRRALARMRGCTLHEMAAAFRVSETLIALREAEVTGEPRAVVSPTLVRVRGPEAWVWPSERELRRGYPGLRRAPLCCEPRRFVLDPTDECP
jgi:hypothetical protein